MYERRVKMYRKFRTANASLYFVGLSAVGFILLYMIIVWCFGWNSTITIYAIAVAKEVDLRIALILFLTLWFIVLANVIINSVHLWLTKKRAVNKIGEKAILLMFLANGLMFGVWAGRIFNSGLLSSWEHVESSYLTGAVYHLTLRRSDESYNDRYYLFECDRYNVFCQKIYDIGRSSTYIETISLQTNSETNTISLMVNEQITYRYQP